MKTILLSGKQGTGKTTLLSNLLKWQNYTNVSFQQLEQCENFDDYLLLIEDYLVVDEVSPSIVLDELFTYLTDGEWKGILILVTNEPLENFKNVKYDFYYEITKFQTN